MAAQEKSNNWMNVPTIAMVRRLAQMGEYEEETEPSEVATAETLSAKVPILPRKKTRSNWANISEDEMERRLQEMKVQKVLVQEEFGPSPYERRQHVQAVTGLLMGSVQRDIYRKEKKPPYAQGAA